MAALTWYLTNTSASVGSDLSETDPGAEATRSPTTGWVVSTGSTNHSAYFNDTERAASTFADTTPPDGSLDTTNGDFWVSPTPLTGDFASANWAVHLAARAGNNGGSQDGRMRCRLFRGPNQDGSGATEVTSAQQQGGLVSDLATDATQVSTATFNPGAFSVDNEYIFIQLAWERTGAGGMTNSDVNLRIGNASGSGSRVVTADFTAEGLSAAVAGTLRSTARLRGAATTKVAVQGQIRATSRIQGTARAVLFLASTSRATARLLGTGSSRVALLVVVRHNARIVGVAETVVAALGYIRSSARLRGVVTPKVVLAGMGRGAGAGRLRSTSLYLVYHATPVRAGARLFAVLSTRVALGGTIRMTARLRGTTGSAAQAALAGTTRTTSRLIGQLGTIQQLAGTTRAVERLQGVLGTRQVVQGQLRGPPGRITAVAVTRLALVGQVRSAARLRGAATTVVQAAAYVRSTALVRGAVVVASDYRGTIRSTARLSATLSTDVALVTQIRGAGRLRGALTVRVPIAGRTQNVARLSASLATRVALAGRLHAGARLWAAVQLTLALESVVRSSGRISGRLAGGPLEPVAGVIVAQARLTAQLMTRISRRGISSVVGVRSHMRVT